MRIFLLSFLMLICALASSQEKKPGKGYFSFALGTYFNKDIDPAVGFHLNGNGALGKGFYAGMEIGVVKFQEMEGIYVPILAKFTIIPNQNSKKISPIAVIEPGFGAYNNAKMGGSAQGGANFFGGAGIAFPESGKGRAFLVVGYSLFGFKVYELNANVETFGIRAGFMLR